MTAMERDGVRSTMGRLVITMALGMGLASAGVASAGEFDGSKPLLCAPTDIAVQRRSGASGSTTKWSRLRVPSMASLPLPGSAAMAPHSRIFAMCRPRPRSKPCMRGSAANMLGSLARPAITTWAPRSSAR